MISVIPKNKLWALCADEESLETAGKYRHIMANDDHCLIISPDNPGGAVEADDEILKLLSPEERAWVLRESQEIWKEWEREHREEWIKSIDDFCERFTDLLLTAMKNETEGAASDSEQKEKGGAAGKSAAKRSGDA